MTDFLANHLTDLLARQPHPAHPQPSSTSVQDQSASPTTSRANKSKPITYSFSTNFGASHSRVGSGSNGGSPASASSQRSSYFSPQQPSVSKLSEENSMIFDMLGCKADQNGHRREESEGSGTSFSSTTTTSPQTHSSSPPEDGVVKPPPIFKSSVNKDQISINENRLSNQTQLEDLSAESLAPISSQQKRQDGGKGPIVRPTFTSMISAPYDPSKQDLMPSVRRSSSNRTTQTASSSSQKRLRLVPVGDDERRFKFVEDEGLVSGTTPLLLKDGSNRFAAVSSSGSEVGSGSGKGKVGGLPANPTTVKSTSSTSIARANHGALDPTFSEAVATPVRLENLGPEEKRAFLLSNSNRRHQDEITKEAIALPSLGGTNSISTPNLSPPIQTSEDGIEVTRGRARQRDTGPTSMEELSSSLIGHLKQSPEAQQYGWEHPQMFMSGADVQSWIKGVVPSEEDSMQEEEDVLEMSQEQLDELQDTFDSLDLNEEGEPGEFLFQFML